MLKVAGVVFFIFAIIVGVYFRGFAGLVDYERLRRYEKAQEEAKAKSGKDAQVKEEDVVPDWLRTETAVTTPQEKRYDVNRDGRFQSSEAKVYLRSVLEEIKEKGAALSGNGILKEYDKNRDGLINRSESEKLSADVYYN